MEYVNGLQDVMNYYYFCMVPFYCLTVINLVVTVSAREWKKSGIKFAVVQVCVFLALTSHFYFLGVLADHNADIRNVNVQMMVLMVLNVIWLITGIIRLRKK